MARPEPITTPARVAEVGLAVVNVLEAIEDRGWATCGACGCLCLPAEVCPGCRANALGAVS